MRNLNAKQRRKKIGSLLLAFLMTVSLCTPISAEGGENVVDTHAQTEGTTGGDSSINQGKLVVSGREKTYSNYYEKYKDKARPIDSPITINPISYASLTPTTDGKNLMPEVEAKTFEGRPEVLLWTNNDGDINYSFDVATEGMYHVELQYFPISGKNTVVEMGLLLDNEYPFASAKNFVLDRYWTDSGPIKKDRKDNDLRPQQKEYDCWVTYPIKDKEGLFNEPYYFYLTPGTHTLTLRGIKMNIALSAITMKNYEAVPDFVKPSQADVDATPALTTPNVLATNTIFIQGENSIYRTASTLYPTYDRTTFMTNPSHPTKQRYNTMGADTWKKSTQAATFEFSVPNDGYYRIGFKARQNKMRGFFSNRRIFIDGVVPNTNLDIVQFPYSPDWYTKTLTDEAGEDLYLYLTAGKHLLTMEAVPGEIGEVMRRLDDLVFTLNYYYRRILMITGPTPDPYNDYFVDKQIPELIPTFEYAIEQLYKEKDGIERMTKKGSEAAALESMAVILKRCVKEKDLIPQIEGSLKDSISAVSAWMRDYRDQPLELDYIEIATAHEEFSPATGSFIDNFSFGFSAFMGSFFEDYTVLSDSTEKSLNVWVASGRDQAIVIKELAENDFNNSHDGVTASINLVQGAILEATLAGKGPEIALFIGGDFPVQLAARDLLVDMTQFKDYEEVQKRFSPNTETYFKYRDGVYGLPLSQNFPMLFYRTDIMEELGFDEPPKTWDEFIDMLPTLQRTYLSVGLLPPTSNMSSSIFDPGDTFTMLMLQTGQDVYNEDLTKTTFDTTASVEAFEKWTKFYTVYNLDQTYDAFSRFRTGEMPMVIQSYPFYNQLSVAAPEIKGLWDFTLIPGTAKADGTVDHTTISGITGAIIFDKVSDTQVAWEFVKWVTSTEIQTQYGRSVEALMGPLGRYDTANLEALKQLPWSSAEYDKISTQQSWTREIPIIPASYATTRHIKNAFRATVNDMWNPRYALTTYNRDINSEIARKNKDLESFSKD